MATIIVLGNDKSVKQATDQIREKVKIGESHRQDYPSSSMFETEESTSNSISKDISQPHSERRHGNARLDSEPNKHRDWRNVTVIIPAEMVKHIIGKRGETINYIQSYSGAYCYVNQNWDKTQQESKQKTSVMIRGSAEAIKLQNSKLTV